MAHKTTIVRGHLSSTGCTTLDREDGHGDSAPWFIRDVPLHLPKHFITVSLYADDTKKRPLSPEFAAPYKITSGTVKVTASPDGIMFGDITGGEMDLTNAKRVVPNCCGGVSIFAVNITNVKPVEISEGSHIYVEVVINSYD